MSSFTYQNLGAPLLANKPPYTLIAFGPDGALPAQQSEWALGIGFLAGRPYAGAAAYIAGAGGSFARASNGMYWDSGKVLRTAAPGVARLDHDPLTGTALGLLAEGARTNLVRWSDDYSVGGTPNGGWLQQAARTHVGGQASPDGGNGAMRIEVNATSGINIQSPQTVPGGPLSVSSFIRKGSGAAEFNQGAIRNNTTNATQRIDGINYDTLAIVAIGGTDRANTRALHRRVANDWIRWSLAHAGFSANDAATMYHLSAGSVETVGRWATAWRAQMEVGYFPSSPIATAGSAVQRNADSLSWPVAGTPAGTVLVHGRTAPGLEGTQTLWRWDDGTGNEVIRLVRDSAGRLRAIATTGGSEVVNLDLGTVADLTDFKVALSWQAGAWAASLNGGAAVTATYAGVPAVTTLREAYPAAAWFGTVAKMVRWAKRYTGSQLQGLTA